MDKKRKAYIDSLWMNTKVGQYIIARSQEKKEVADQLFEEIFWEEYLSYDQSEAEVCKAVAKELSGEYEFDEYLRLLDKENHRLVGYIIRSDSLLRVYDYLNE